MKATRAVGQIATCAAETLGAIGAARTANQERDRRIRDDRGKPGIVRNTRQTVS